MDAPQDQPTTPKPAPNNKSRIILLIIFVLAILAGVILMHFLDTKAKLTPVNQSSPNSYLTHPHPKTVRENPMDSALFT
jgi:hypothetical protein